MWDDAGYTYRAWDSTESGSTATPMRPPLERTSLKKASSIVSNQRGCTAQKLAEIPVRPDILEAVSSVRAFLPSYNLAGQGRDSLSIWQGSRSGHGPGNHFDVLIERAGGANAATGDYLFRTYPADQLDHGLWGIFRVQSCAKTAAEPEASGATAKGGGGR